MIEFLATIEPAVRDFSWWWEGARMLLGAGFGLALFSAFIAGAVAWMFPVEWVFALVSLFLFLFVFKTSLEDNGGPSIELLLAWVALILGFIGALLTIALIAAFLDRQND